ncbi:MAG: hypothetical protein ACLPLR_06105 [Terriglobales bacterium]
MKTHLKDSAEPLIAGQDQVALCGRTVGKAAFVFQFDTGSGKVEGLSTILFCRECMIQLALLGEKSRRYLYGMLDGEQAKHLEGVCD